MKGASVRGGYDDGPSSVYEKAGKLANPRFNDTLLSPTRRLTSDSY
jgi:hypothetical protein